MSWIYSRAKNGKVRLWRTWAEGAEVSTEYGEKDGAMQFSSYIAKAVNVGKSNERNAEQQAVFEADASRRKKLETGWAETEAGIDSVIKLPMLAHKLSDHIAKLVPGILIQPKLDGIRCHVHCVATGEFKFMSRKGKEMRQFPHLVTALTLLMWPGEIFDGEIYKHGVTLQKLSGIARKKGAMTPEEEALIELHAYDIADDEKVTEERSTVLHTRFANMAGAGVTDVPVKLVKTYEGDNEDDVFEAHSEFVSEGYEGTMIRLPGHCYEFNDRSMALLKHKDFLEEEFEIVGYKEGVGKMAGAIIFRCKAKGGEFDVKMRGTIDSLKDLWDRREETKGKLLTVRFQAYTPYGIPEFPVGIVIRDYE